jgi:small GTP-binding protein
MISPTLTQDQRQILADERTWLGRLQVALGRLDVAADEIRALERSIRQLDHLFLLVVVGEFNAGKSAFINALLGSRLLEEGVTPTTTSLQATRYGDRLEHRAELGGVSVVTAPVELLRHLEIVDTPGTNAIFREHEALTTDFVPRADLVIFLTSADRPFTESERAFLETIREWGKKLIVVINKIDILESAEDVDRVVSFVRRGVEDLLGVTPEIFPVSSRQALRRKQGGRDESPHAGDLFETLERFLGETLDERERVRLKLLNPIGVASRLLTQAIGVVAGRLDLLQEDLATLDELDGQLDLYRTDMDREFRYRLSHADNALHEFEQRGMVFFDDTLRLARVFDLLNKARLKAEYERRVVADTSGAIERNVNEIIDWMVESDLRQWESVMERLRRRQAAHPEQLVGQAGEGFTYDRARLLDTVGRAAERAVEAYDREREASQLAESVQMAVAGTALAQAGALGLGTAVAALASTTFADITGLLAAGTLAAIGLFVLPMRRQQAKRELRDKIAAMRTNLVSALTTQFEREILRSIDRIRDAVAPYSRFVRAQREKLVGARDELTAIQEALNGIRLRIER